VGDSLFDDTGFLRTSRYGQGIVHAFFVCQTANYTMKTMPLIPFGRRLAAKRTNKNQRISCLPNEKTLPLQKEIRNITQLNTNKTKI
jgi:hypothetical protein